MITWSCCSPISSISTSFRLIFITKTPMFKPTLKFLRPITFVPISAAAAPPPPSPPPSISAGDLPPTLREIVTLFQSVQEPKAKYEQLLFYGKNLKPLSERFKTKSNRVEGCVSQVWVRAFLDEDKRLVFFEADSDSVLTKGLAALLVNGLSGRPVEEVLGVSPEFVVLLGLNQSLTPSRNNGFLNMLRLMQKKALELLVQFETGSVQSGLDQSLSLGESLSSVSGDSIQMKSNSDESLTLGKGLSSESEDLIATESSSEESLSFRENSSNEEWSTEESSSFGESLSSLGSRGARIREKLMKELTPTELEVEDVSYQHAGHAGIRGSGDGETHFNVSVVSKAFEGKSLVKRHRLVYGLLQDELDSGLHALSIVAKTPQEVS